MTMFVIEPYVGPLPLRFGMTPSEVEAIIGKPISSFEGALGWQGEERDNFKIGYSAEDQRIFDVAFSEGAKLLFQGRDLFSEADAIGFLCQFDNSPFEWVGNIIFLKLGIRLSGFHEYDEDEPGKAIGVVKKGNWDEYVEDFEPYDVKK